jgi:hypothetical protein
MLNAKIYPYTINKVIVYSKELSTMENQEQVQQFRRRNALVRTQAQRDKIKTSLTNNSKEGLDARHDGFKLDGTKVMYPLPTGDQIQLLMTSEDVEKQMRIEYDKAENAGKGQNSLYWFMKQRFLNITRNDIVKFLKSDEEYVLAQPTKPLVNKSVHFTAIHF